MTRWGSKTTKNSIRNRRTMVWVCRFCDHWHRHVKPGACQNCGNGEFLYFASHIEAKRYVELLLLQRHGKITRLRTQVVFPFKHNGVDIGSYRADFTYTDTNGEHITEDVKPKAFRDDVYKLKAKMMAAFYGIIVKEVEG